MGTAKGATAVWAHHGSTSGLEELLPGVKVRVLGPPDLDADRRRSGSSGATDPDQFWHLLAGPRIAPGRRARSRRGCPGTSRSGPSRCPPEARWFRDRLERMRGEQLLEIVRTLDEQMNNTSLILLFEVFGKKLLFPGDAQIENWSYALEDAPDAAKTRALLADVDVYKVGHHGSLNATPKKLLWEDFKHRNKRDAAAGDAALDDAGQARQGGEQDGGAAPDAAGRAEGGDQALEHQRPGLREDADLLLPGGHHALTRALRTC